MVSKYFMEIRMDAGGGVFKLGNPEGRGAQAVLEIHVEGRGVKTLCLPSGGVDFFWNYKPLSLNM